MSAFSKSLQGPMLALVLVAVGVGAFVVSTSVDTDPTAEAGRDGAVNEGAKSQGDISANNSPTIVRNPRDPRNLAVANRIDGPRYACALHVSRDGGRRWSRVPIEIPRGEERKCFAPDVTFGADGRLHMSYVTLRGNGNVPHAGWFVSSDDGGRTLSRPRRVIGPLGFQVRVIADRANPRLIYLAWLQADDVGLFRFTTPENPIVVARSTDGGATWERPVRVSDPDRRRVVAPSLALGPKGELYVLYLELGGDRLDYEGLHRGRGGRPFAGRFKLVLARSLDRGASWAESVVEDRIVPTERFIAFLPPFPSVAVDDRSGRIYAGFQDGRRGKSDVLVWSRGTDDAAWKGPVRVNDTPEEDDSSQYLPKLAVAPNGRLDVVYYDRRADPGDKRNEVSLQSSFDHGASFGDSVPVSSQAFDSGVGYGNERELPDLGSRLGLLSEDDSAVAVWSDTRAGTVDTNKQDIAIAHVTLEEPGALTEIAKYGLRFGGLALALAGLALLVTSMRSRPAPAQT